MNDLLKLMKADLKLLKWPGLFFGIAVVVSLVFFLGGQYLLNNAQEDMRVANANMNQRRIAVEEIEQEEETVMRYIGRYREMQDDGLLQDEDRLTLMEVIMDTRSRNQLYATNIVIGEQSESLLDYGVAGLEEGEMVALQSTAVDLTLPLLHEEDLTRLLDGVLSMPGLMQTESCVVSKREDVSDLLNMGENLRAQCVLLWYHFNLSPSVPLEEGY